MYSPSMSELKIIMNDLGFAQHWTFMVKKWWSIPQASLTFLNMHLSGFKQKNIPGAPTLLTLSKWTGNKIAHVIGCYFERPFYFFRLVFPFLMGLSHIQAVRFYLSLTFEFQNLILWKTEGLWPRQMKWKYVSLHHPDKRLLVWGKRSQRESEEGSR